MATTTTKDKQQQKLKRPELVSRDSASDIPAHEYYSSSNYVSRHKTIGTSNKTGIITPSPSQGAPGSPAPMSPEGGLAGLPATEKVVPAEAATKYRRPRRGSHDDKTSKPRRFLIDVEETQKLILEQEDTDGDFQITVNDMGPKVITLGTADSAGYNKYDVRGTYMLSNLLQELSLAQDYGRKYIVLDEARLNENPVDRLSRMIRHHFWDGLTRRIDAEGLEMISKDPKNRSRNTAPRIYVPFGEDQVLAYYQNVAVTKPHLKLEVEQLPKDMSPKFVQSINDKPGILALAMTKFVNEEGQETLKGVPFVVPGGRFNEMYGWDSYFESLGLLVDGRLELAKGMVDNFVYEIQHYGKILNANRSYYLTRTQPPFLTDMMLKVYDRLPFSLELENKQWLAVALTAAIKEYETIWMSQPRYDPESGLSRFYSEGVGMPPETEATHFDHVIKPYADARNMTLEEFADLYNAGEANEPDLDTYFKHDRAVRESGHDTTYRLDNCCADIATVDLNALLYKYEVDIAETIQSIFGDSFETLRFSSYENDQDVDGGAGRTTVVHSSEEWFERARIRQQRMNQYCWNEERGLYFDYDTGLKKMGTYESVTTFYTMWAGLADREKADRMMTSALPLFEVTGGLVSGTESSRGLISLDRPNRQWDFPFGWAPHQILSWIGFEKYGYLEETKRCCYRWLYTITKSFVDFNGVVPEKFDVVNMTHKVQVEYGNVGVDFKFIPREGFGWMNASYQVGLGYMDRGLRRALGAVMEPGRVFEVRQLTLTEQAKAKASRDANDSLVSQPPNVTTKLVRPKSLRA